MRKKIDKDYIDFGQWLYELRIKKNITEDELVELINIESVQKNNIKKWERDLEFPDLDIIYKLSEIYMISSTEIIDKKNKTLENGMGGIHKTLIRWISFFLNISIYSTIWLSNILLYGTLILAWIWFYQRCKMLRIFIIKKEDIV